MNAQWVFKIDKISGVNLRFRSKIRVSQGLKMSENGDFWCPGASIKISKWPIFGLREAAQHYVDPKIPLKKGAKLKK